MMSIDPDEAAREEWFADLYDENSKQALHEFRRERLQSYLLANPEVARPAFGALRDAVSLLPDRPMASLVLASAAAEVGLKAVLLRPVVVGLVHSEALAGHVADLVLQHQAVSRFHDLLFAVLKEYGGLDLTTYKRAGANIERRNAVLHRCEAPAGAEATQAVAVASEILTVLFPALVKNLGLHLHDGYRACNDSHVTERLAELLGGSGDPV
jgi:hypothetical protein